MLVICPRYLYIKYTYLNALINTVLDTILAPSKIKIMLSHYLNKHRGALILATVFAKLLTISLLQASPLVSIGDNAEIYFDGSSTARWTSNVFLTDRNEVEDFLYILSPGFEFNLGRDASNADLSIVTRYDIIRYSDLTELDVELLHVKLRGAYKSSRLELTVSANYDEQKSNSGDIQIIDDLIESTLSGGEVNGEYRISPKFSFGAGAEYFDTEYTGVYEGVLTDQERKRLPLDIFYELTPKLDLTLGYIYSDTEVGAINSVIDFAENTDGSFIPIELEKSSYNRGSHFFNLGARGSLFPKLTGYFKVGYQKRESGIRPESTVINGTILSNNTTNYSEETTLGMDADIYWTFTPKLSARLGLSRDFGVGSDGAPTRENSLSLSSNLSLNNNWVANANLMYTQRDYTYRDREDDKYTVGLRVFYMPNMFWQFSGGYNFSDSESTGDQAGNSYDAHVVDLNATLRY